MAVNKLDRCSECGTVKKIVVVVQPPVQSIVKVRSPTKRHIYTATVVKLSDRHDSIFSAIITHIDGVPKDAGQYPNPTPFSTNDIVETVDPEQYGIEDLPPGTRFFIVDDEDPAIMQECVVLDTDPMDSNDDWNALELSSGKHCYVHSKVPVWLNPD